MVAAAPCGTSSGVDAARRVFRPLARFAGTAGQLERTRRPRHNGSGRKLPPTCVKTRFEDSQERSRR